MSHKFNLTVDGVRHSLVRTQVVALVRKVTARIRLPLALLQSHCTPRRFHVLVTPLLKYLCHVICSHSVVRLRAHNHSCMVFFHESPGNAMVLGGTGVVVIIGTLDLNGLVI